MSKIKLTLSLLLTFFIAGSFAQSGVVITHNDAHTLNRSINLVANGSFEDGPSVSNGAPSEMYFWTRNSNTNKPASWTATGDDNSYGFWGWWQANAAGQYGPGTPTINTLITSTGASDYMYSGSSATPFGDGKNLLYFGNYELVTGAPAPAYNPTSGEYIPSASVPAAVAGLSWLPGTGALAGLTITAPITLSQTVTGLVVGAQYEMEFWVTGEDGGPGNGFEADGIFQLNLGPTLKYWLTAPGIGEINGLGKTERYHITFTATSTTMPISFINYGHIHPFNNPNMPPSWYQGNLALGTGKATELALDDVIINPVGTATIIGNLFIDANQNGVFNNPPEVNYTATPTYASIVASDGTVLGTALLNSGTYSIPGAPLNTLGLTVKLSTTPQTIGTAFTTTGVPTGYSATTPLSLTLPSISAGSLIFGFYPVPFNFGIFFGILPVEFGGLNGKLTNGTASLTWLTYAEQNSAYFEVQKSNSGSFAASDRKVVGKVTAAGFSSVQKQYSFNDAKDNSTVSYYRLKMVDNDGSFQYSNVVAIRADGLSAGFVYAANPNPFGDHINLGIKMNVKGTATVSLVDLTGRKLVTRQVNLFNGNNNFNLNGLGNLPKGIYILDVSTQDNTMRYKLLKD
jgi:Secretion system C-terminal sorting domain